ncbi:MAG: hypothetical protein RR471_10895 [Bacteroides sp.]
MKKQQPITDQDIYVSCTRNHSDSESSECIYSIFYYGNQEMDSLTADEAKQIIDCLQHALNANEQKGAEQ